MPRRTLGLKISLFFLIVALIPFAIISALFYFQVRENTGDVIRQNLSNLASEVGVEIERTIFSAHTHIRSLAENPIIKSDEALIEEKLFEMQKVHNFYKVFEDITFVDLEGVVLASTTYDFRGEWMYKEWFRRAKAGEAVVSPVHVILYPTRFVMITTAPVVGEDGAIRAVLAGRMNMERIWEITDRVKVGRTGFVFVSDKEGNLVAYPDKGRLLYKLGPESLKDEILVGQSGTTEFLAAEGVGKLCHYRALKGYQDYEGQGWQVGIIQDTNDAYTIINKMRIQALSVAAFGIAVILSLAGLLTRNIVRPVKALAKATERIAKGDLSTKVTLRTKDEIGDLGNAFNKMTEDLKTSQDKLEESYLESVLALAKAVDTRDAYTADHSQRMAAWTEATARELGCNEDELQAIRWATLLHDIGKIGVPDEILRKPGSLNEDEWAVVKRHPELGVEIIAPLKKLSNVIPIVRGHHERYDGSGYPQGLKGEAIPLGACILAVVDGYCAMTDERVYRKALSHGEAVAELRRCAGRHFDPRVVEAFLRVLERGKGGGSTTRSDNI